MLFLVLGKGLPFLRRSRPVQHLRLIPALLALAAAAPLLATAQAPVPPAPQPPQLRFVYEEFVTLAASVPVGETPRGKRNIVPITGGTFQGPGMRGTIVPGGWDWQLTLPSGCFQLHADYFIKTDDSVIIHVVNAGMVCPNSAGQRDVLFTSPQFEAPKGKYDWLNGGVFVGTLEVTRIEGKPAVHIRFYKVVSG
jgi:hypothetical protein